MEIRSCKWIFTFYNHVLFGSNVLLVSLLGIIWYLNSRQNFVFFLYRAANPLHKHRFNPFVTSLFWTLMPKQFYWTWNVSEHQPWGRWSSDTFDHPGTLSDKEVNLVLVKLAPHSTCNGRPCSTVDLTWFDPTSYTSTNMDNKSIGSLGPSGFQKADLIEKTSVPWPCFPDAQMVRAHSFWVVGCSQFLQ